MRVIVCAAMLLALVGCRAYSGDTEGAGTEPTPRPQPALSEDRQPANADVRAQFDIRQIHYAEPATQEKKPKGNDDKLMSERLKLADGLPGANTPDFQMPPANATREQIDAAIKKQFPPLPAMPHLPAAQPGPGGAPLHLADLQQIALAASPLIRQAQRDVDAARGRALQAGLYPNPIVGYEASTIGQGNTPGQQGGFVEQTVKTKGKLTLARAAALAQVQIAEERLRQVESDVLAQVRHGYFAVLSARTRFEVTRSLAQSTDSLYEVLLAHLRAEEVAAYETIQIRVLALQARGQLIQARNRYISQWQQLTAALGTPGMPITELEGRLDIPLPFFDRAAVMAAVLSRHTDVTVARLGVEKSRLLTRLAEAQPFPDVNLHVALQKDYTQAPFGTVANVSVGVPVPFWDRNQGNIQQAQALLRRALLDEDRVHNELSGQAAEAFERYDNNRAILELYNRQILPNQVQAFRAAVARHAAIGDKNVSYNDMVTAQQALASAVNSYLAALGEQWRAVVDIAHLLQTRDLFQVERCEEVAPIPEVPAIHPE